MPASSVGTCECQDAFGLVGSSRVSVSVLPALSSPVHFISVQCPVSVFLVVCFAPVLVFSLCFALVLSLVSPLLLPRVFNRVFRLAWGGVSLSLSRLVCVRLSPVCVRVFVLSRLSLALTYRCLPPVSSSSGF